MMRKTDADQHSEAKTIERRELDPGRLEHSSCRLGRQLPTYLS
jgi:hypothetical protein